MKKKQYVIEVCGGCVPRGHTFYITPNGCMGSDVLNAVLVSAKKLPKTVSQETRQRCSFRFVAAEYVFWSELKDCLGSAEPTACD